VKDPVAIVEAAYAFDAPDEASWLSRVAREVRSNLPSAPAAVAYAFEIQSRGSLPWIVPRSLTAIDVAPQLGAMFLNPPVYGGKMQDVMQLATTSYHRSTGLRSGMKFVESIDEFAQVARFYRQNFEAQGFHDVLTLIAADPTPEGCVVMLPVHQSVALTPSTRARWQRVAAHVSMGFRLRRKIEGMLSQSAADAGEAILSPAGRLEHATGAARETSVRQAFRAAVLRLERARGSLRRRDPDEAIELWRGLVCGRWSLVDRFERDGRRYLVAHRNDPEVADPRTLTPRERQIVGYAALGQSNKLIAYELGLSPSTVGVVLAGAAKKLRVTSRADLVAMFPPSGGGSSAARLEARPARGSELPTKS
jgi:DNA-binding CsgD family transcriptional regulator